MRVHHVNGGVLGVAGGKLIDGDPGYLRKAEMVCHCLLIETDDSGLVLVDTGIGLNGARDPGRWLGFSFQTLIIPRRDEEQTVVGQIKRLGFAPEDVRHIVLTHLDVDHAGGLADFPDATVHLYAAEHEAAMAPPSFKERERYRKLLFAHGPQWRPYGEHGEGWFGFDAVRGLDGLPPEILLVPLTGHTRGHTGVAVDTGEGWLLHAGDAYFHHGEMDPAGVHCPPGLTVFQNAMQTVKSSRLHNRTQLNGLVREHGGEVTVFSAHSGVELRRCQAATTH